MQMKNKVLMFSVQHQIGM